MHPMFDFATDPAVGQNTAPARVLALKLIASSSAGLVAAASRLGGDAGSALMCALRDMIIDATVDPFHWPIEEAIALLLTPARGRDGQTDRLVVQLERIRDRIRSGPGACTA